MELLSSKAGAWTQPKNVSLVDEIPANGLGGPRCLLFREIDWGGLAPP